jgi:5'-nucleotidase
MNQPKLIAADVDGFLANLHVPWYGRYNKDYDDNLQVDTVTEWGVHKFVKPECGTKIYEYLDDPTLYDDVLPYCGALETITALKNFGHRVIYATASPAKSYGRKFDWLKQYGFITDQKDYIETRDKSLVRADILIDDYQGNLDVFVGRKILFGQPWNLSEEFNPKYLYAYTWREVILYCNE